MSDINSVHDFAGLETEGSVLNTITNSMVLYGSVSPYKVTILLYGFSQLCHAWSPVVKESCTSLHKHSLLGLHMRNAL